MSSITPEEDRQAPLPTNPFAEPASKVDETQVPLSFATQRLPWAVGLLALLLCGLMNAAAVPIAKNMSGPPEGVELIVLAVGVGILGGQIGALSAVLVWGRGPFLVRCLLLWLIGMALFGCWWLGLLTAIDREYWFDDFRIRVARAIIASLPLISLAMQLPQWLARFYFGWRIEPPGNGAAVAATGLSIRDLLVGTVVAALTVTAVRFSQEADEMTTVVWAAWGMAVGIIAVISAVLMLPLLVLTFRFYPGWAILFIALASPLIVGATIYAIMLLEPGDGGPDVRAVVTMFLIAGTTCVAVTSIPLWLARWAGYRLKFGREE
jgi:hypothetical protein